MTYGANNRNQDESGSNQPNIAVTLTGVPAGANVAVFVGFHHDGSQSVSGVSDGTNSLTQRGSTIRDTSNNQGSNAWTFENHPGGNPTFTATFNAPLSFPRIRAVYYTDVAAFRNAIEQFQASPSPSPATNGVSSGNTTGTNIEDGDTVVGWTQNTSDASSLADAGTGFTLRTTPITQDYIDALEDKVHSGGAGADAATFSLPSSSTSSRLTHLIAWAPLTGATTVVETGHYALNGQGVGLGENLQAADYIGGLLAGSPLSFVGEAYIGALDVAPGGGATTQVTPGSYALSGQAVGSKRGRNTVVTHGVYELTGSDVLADSSTSVTPGSYALAGQDVGSTKSGSGNVSTEVTQGSYALSGQAVGSSVTRRTVVTQGNYALSGQGVRVAADRNTAVSQGSYALSGQPVGSKHGRNTVVTQGAYALNGQAVGSLLSRATQVTQGSYALSGQSVGSRRGLVTLATPGTYALSGQAVGSRIDRRTVVTQGSYALSGQDVGSTVIGAGAVTNATAGNYALNGQVVGSRTERRTVVTQGNYTLTGNGVALAHGYALEVEQGTYALAGQSVRLAVSRVLSALQGTYALSGQAVQLRRGYRLPVTTGGYALTGIDVGSISDASQTLVVERGLYALTGSPVGSTYGAIEQIHARIWSGVRSAQVRVRARSGRAELT